MADPYLTLGVAKNADDAAIKKAYRKLAKQFHPDRNKDNPSAARKFAEISAAYGLLTDREKRARYDRGEIDENGSPTQAFAFSDDTSDRGARGSADRFTFAEDADLSSVLEGLFGQAGYPRTGRSRQPPPGPDAAYTLRVSFEDAATAKPQDIQLPNGRRLQIPLPHGVETGTRIVLRGEGEQGPGGTGDAIFTVDILPHPLFRRVGDDVHAEIPIRIDEAVLGAKVRVPTIDGEVVLTIPKSSTSGRQLRIRGKGALRRDGGRGNQVVRLMVDIPPRDAELEAFAARWNGRSYDPRSRIRPNP